MDMKVNILKSRSTKSRVTHTRHHRPGHPFTQPITRVESNTEPFRNQTPLQTYSSKHAAEVQSFNFQNALSASQ